MAAFVPLTDDTIKELLEPKERINNQVGPIRFYDTEMQCASRRCGSPTYIKFKGMPQCMMHTILRANELLVELLEKREGVIT